MRPEEENVTHKSITMLLRDGPPNSTLHMNLTLRQFVYLVLIYKHAQVESVKQ